VLKGNNDNVSSMRWLGGSYATIIDTTGDQNKILNNGLTFGMKVGKPYGYNGLNGMLLPVKPGGFIRATLSGSADFTSVITCIANMIATLSGVGAVNPNINAAYNMVLTMAGNGTLTPVLKAIGNMSAAIDAGSRPSAFDITQEIWNAQSAQYNSSGTMGNKLNGAGSAGNPWTEVIESGLNAGEVMKIIAAVMAGKTIITKGTGHHATIIFRNINDTKDVLSASMDGSERTDISLDTE
jgi:hypothetical protein